MNHATERSHENERNVKSSIVSLFCLNWCMFHASDKRNSQVPNCSLYRGSETLIFERKCHSVADLRERSPPPPRSRGRGAVAGFQSKKKVSFFSEGAERNRRLCFLQLLCISLLL